MSNTTSSWWSYRWSSICEANKTATLFICAWSSQHDYKKNLLPGTGMLTMQLYKLMLQNYELIKNGAQRFGNFYRCVVACLW